MAESLINYGEIEAIQARNADRIAKPDCPG
jgi:hypothetical protein